MHPEIARTLAGQRGADLRRAARRARAARRLQHGRWRWPGPLGRRGLATAGGQPPAALPGVFLAGPQAFGLRAYLTAEEASELAAGACAQLARFSDRLGDPRRRPAGAVQVEVVVLARRLPDLAGIAPGHAGGVPGE
jgi:hypothetical protein